MRYDFLERAKKEPKYSEKDGKQEKVRGLCFACEDYDEMVKSSSAEEEKCRK